MQLRELYRDDDAVAPVIAVILMVAVTVVLAAVIGSFVLGFRGGFVQSAPQVTFAYDFEGGGAGEDCTLSTDDGDTVGVLTITHDSGKLVRGDELSLQSDDVTKRWQSDCSGGTEVTAGDTVSVKTASGETVRIVWTGEDTSATIARWAGDDA